MATRTCRCGGTVDPEEVEVAVSGTCRECGGQTTTSFSRPAGDLPSTESSVIRALRRQLDAPAPGDETRTDAPDPELLAHAEAPTHSPAGSPDAPPADLDLEAGTEIGDFRLVDRIGAGGMGVVFRAHDTSLDREVAVKFLSPHLTENPEFVARFRREARAAARVSHPFLTHIYSIGEEDDLHYFVMELIEGRSIDDVLADRKRIPHREAAELVQQAARGLAFAYAKVGIIHRDLKPSNLLVTPEGRVKVTDFGLAKLAMGSPDITQTGAILGTPLYMSPEQGKGKTADHRSDIYALGATLYHMVYGRPPFGGETSFQILIKHAMERPRFTTSDDVPPAVVGVLRRALQKDPEDRYPAYDPFIDDLGRLAAGELPEGAEDQEDTNRITFLEISDQVAKAAGSSLQKSRFRVAETNISMGRREKAINLLRGMLDDPGPTRVLAALKLIQLEEEEDPDSAAVRELAEIVFEEADDPDLRAFAGWKIAHSIERASLDRLEAALEAFRSIPGEAAGLPDGLLETKIEEVEQRIRRAAHSLSASDVRLRQRKD